MHGRTEGKKGRKVLGEHERVKKIEKKRKIEDRERDIYIKKRKGNSVRHIEPCVCSKEQK